MFHKIVEKFKTVKRLKIILIAVLMLVAVVVILIFATVSSGKWSAAGIMVGNELGAGNLKRGIPCGTRRGSRICCTC